MDVDARISYKSAANTGTRHQKHGDQSKACWSLAGNLQVKRIPSGATETKHRREESEEDAKMHSLLLVPTDRLGKVVVMLVKNGARSLTLAAAWMSRGP
jgi:hypothetical protein